VSFCEGFLIKTDCLKVGNFITRIKRIVGGRAKSLYPSCIRKLHNKAKKDFPDIDFKKSVMVGDSISDIQFGKNVQMKTVYISVQQINTDSDMICASLYDFAKIFFV